MTEDETLKELIEDLISAMEYHVEQTRQIHSTTVALQAAREALKSLPPQRTWVGLTDEEICIEAMKKDQQSIGFIKGAEWAEVKLKEKNT